MSRRPRDAEITALAAQLDGLLDGYGENVAALRGILTRPGPPGQGAADERLVAPLTEQQRPDREAIGAANDLSASLDTMAVEVKRLRSYGRTNRKFAIAGIILTVLVFLAGALAIHALQRADSANNAQLALCRSSNVARAQQIGIWQFVINISGPAKTAREKKIRATFLAHLHQVYAKRDCEHLG